MASMDDLERRRRARLEAEAEALRPWVTDRQLAELSYEQRSSILMFLSGYLHHNPEFQSGLSRAYELAKRGEL